MAVKVALVDYFAQTLPSLGHTSIYKIHKYFARRPHNQFRSLIEHYVPEGGVVLDCFAGGGVTLVEALTSNRRVVSIDINPIASLVQRGQTVEVLASDVNEMTTDFAEKIRSDFGNWFMTTCEHCSEKTPYRWIERAYLVNCPHCGTATALTEPSKAVGKDGKSRSGHYSCTKCQEEFQSVDSPRIGSTLLNIRYRCARCADEFTKVPAEEDRELDRRVLQEEEIVLKRWNTRVPYDRIPLEWDRQSEDALSRKGFVYFSDLFSGRNRVFLACLLQQLRQVRGDIDEPQFISVLTQLSALIRYVNSMTFATSAWMDGRPVAWAKHAFWTPNQFIEVNPFEYLEHRQLATRKWENDRSARFRNKKLATELEEVVRGEADYGIVCADARAIDLPNACVDAVITDPPFGSNVQYGELTHLWQVWLGDLNPYGHDLFDLGPEILIHRKPKPNRKTAADYETGLSEVFLECHRIIKPNGVLVFTFNNKSAEAWHSVMKAAFDAGFKLESEGIRYQEEIKAYRDTAHLRFSNELQGDILYTFVKQTPVSTPLVMDRVKWLREFISKNKQTTKGDVDIAVEFHVEVVRHAAKALQAQGNKDEVMGWLELLTLVGKVNRSNAPILQVFEKILSNDK